jgi:MFS transporter, DHA1 family, putative efflux transporter
MQTVKRDTATVDSGLLKLAVGWLTMFVVGSDLFVVSPLLPLIATDYTVTAASAALSITVFAAAYMLSAPLMGRLADRIGCVRILIYCLCGFAAANLLTAAAASLVGLLLARLFAGVAAAGVSPPLYALVAASAPPDRRARWLAIVVSGLLVSLALAASAGLLAAASLGWAAVFAGLGAVSICLTGANYRVWRDHRATEKVDRHSDRLNPPAVIARLAPTVVWSMAVYAMYTYLGEGLTSLGYATGDVAEAILFYGCGAIGGVLLGGHLADRLGTKVISAVGLAGLCFCILLLRLALQAGVLLDCAFGLTSLAAQLFFPAQQVRLANDFPANRAAVLAWNNSALFLGITLGSVIGGRAISLGGYDLDLMIAAATAFLAWTLNLAGYWPQAAAVIPPPPRPSGPREAS